MCRNTLFFLVLVFAPLVVYSNEIESVSGLESDSLSFAVYAEDVSPDRHNTNLFSRFCVDNRTRLSKDIPIVIPTFISDYKQFHFGLIPKTRKQLLLTSGVLATGGLIFANDKDIYDTFHRNKNHWTLKNLHEFGDGIQKVGLKAVTLKYYMGAFAVGYLTDNKFLKNTSIDILEAGLIGSIIQTGTKFTVGRSRPVRGDGPYSFETANDDAFFSAHSANVTQLAVILAHNVNYTPFTIAAYTTAGSVCVQRILSSRHWPSDVFFGVMWGWITAKSVINRGESLLSINSVTNEHLNGISIGYRL